MEVPLSQHDFGSGPSLSLALDTTSPGFSVKLGGKAVLCVSQGFKEASASEAMQEGWAMTVDGPVLCVASINAVHGDRGRRDARENPSRR